MRITFQRTLTEQDLERGVFEAVGVWVARLKRDSMAVQVYDCEYGHLTMAVVGTHVKACECGDPLSSLVLIEQDTKG